MGARNQVGLGLSYQHASLCSLATQFQTRFLESIPRPIAGLKIPTQYTIHILNTKHFIVVFALGGWQYQDPVTSRLVFIWQSWARILKLLRSSGIDSKESFSSAYLAWRAGTITLFPLLIPSLHRMFKNSSSVYPPPLYTTLACGTHKT